MSSHLHSALKVSFSFRVFKAFKCRVPCSGSVQVVNQRLLFATTRVRSVSNPHAIFSENNYIGTGFSASVWSCQCYSDNGPYSLIYLLPVLCDFSDQERQKLTHLSRQCFEGFPESFMSDVLRN
jgi:hypothetical protein